MFILITYDVNITSTAGQKRLRKVARECLNFGQRVQNSVFECVVSEAQYILLKDKLQHIINPNEDSIIFYNLGNHWQRKVIRIGKSSATDVCDTIII